MQDKSLVCKECGAEFAFTVSEQEFFAEKGFTNEPGRCPDCRRARKERSSGGFGRNYQQREMHDVVCAACGVETQVPFRPSSDRPVYCRDCFNQNRKSY